MYADVCAQLYALITLLSKLQKNAVYPKSSKGNEYLGIKKRIQVLICACS